MPIKAKRTKKERRRRGFSALNSAAADLAYEWITARQAFNYIELGKKEKDQKLINVSLEDFLLHSGNIRDFFSWSNNDNDVIAWDYLKTSLRVRMPYLRKNRKRLNRRIAHLSYSRLYMSSTWKYGLIMKEIDNSMDVFIERLKLVNESLANKIMDLITIR